LRYDAVIIGGGPAGLSAALVLGRARKRVLLCDAGLARNAKAERVRGFVTRDGEPPADFRREARRQLEPYTSVELRDLWVEGVEGESGSFRVATAEGPVEASRVLLCVGMVDEMPALPGFEQLWGHSAFQCPYCHGWEARDRTFGLLATTESLLEFALLLQAWTQDLIVFTSGEVEVDAERREKLSGCEISLEERPVRALVADGGDLRAVELADGTRIERQILFAKPKQHQTELVTAMGLELDDDGFIRVDEHKQTARPGVYAAGDAVTPPQIAIVAASDGAQAAYSLNNDLTLNRARDQRC
jgi:thioredoxin reductase